MYNFQTSSVFIPLTDPLCQTLHCVVSGGLALYVTLTQLFRCPWPVNYVLGYSITAPRDTWPHEYWSQQVMWQGQSRCLRSVSGTKVRLCVLTELFKALVGYKCGLIHSVSFPDVFHKEVNITDVTIVHRHDVVRLSANHRARTTCKLVTSVYKHEVTSFIFFLHIVMFISRYLESGVSEISEKSYFSLTLPNN